MFSSNWCWGFSVGKKIYAQDLLWLLLAGSNGVSLSTDFWQFRRLRTKDSIGLKKIIIKKKYPKYNVEINWHYMSLTLWCSSSSGIFYLLNGNCCNSGLEELSFTGERLDHFSSFNKLKGGDPRNLFSNLKCWKPQLDGPIINYNYNYKEN